MNKSNRQYQRALTTNSFNQDFIYYKYSKELHKSPKIIQHSLSYQQHQPLNNHSIIQTMKNTLNTLPTDKIRKSQIINFSKSLHQESIDDINYNNKLYSLTEKLRKIAQKKHFSTAQDPNKKEKNRKVVCKTSQDTYVNNIQLIHKKNLINQQTKLQEYISKETNQILQRQKDNKKTHNYSQQLVRSQSKSSGSFYKYDMGSDNSQSSSLKRQPKINKNQKSINTFNFSQEIKKEFQFSQRPRGKTVANLLCEPLINDMQSTKIKINSFLQKKEPINKSLNQDTEIAYAQRGHKSLKPTVLHVLSSHRGPITSMIVNNDGKRLLTASNDYTIRESTLEGTYSVLRKHKGRVNVMRMIDDKLYSGGNDCKLMVQRENITFSSPVVQIYSGYKDYINVGTSSSIQQFNLTKKITQKSIDIKTKWYKIFQKTTKDIYMVDNHNLYVVDWRVPCSLIHLYDGPNFAEDWVSDPLVFNFHQIRNRELIQIDIRKDNKTTEILQHVFEEDIRDCCWKKDKAYFLTINQVQIFDNSRNHLQLKSVCALNLDKSKPCKLQIKNDLCFYGTLDGKIVVSKFA